MLLDILGLNDFRSALRIMYTGYGIISGVAAPFIGECYKSPFDCSVLQIDKLIILCFTSKRQYFGHITVRYIIPTVL